MSESVFVRLLVSLTAEPLYCKHNSIARTDAFYIVQKVCEMDTQDPRLINHRSSAAELDHAPNRTTRHQSSLKTLENARGRWLRLNENKNASATHASVIDMSLPTLLPSGTQLYCRGGWTALK